MNRKLAFLMVMLFAVTLISGCTQTVKTLPSNFKVGTPDTDKSQLYIGSQPRIWKLDRLAAMPAGYELVEEMDEKNYDYYLLQFGLGNSYNKQIVRNVSFQVQFGLAKSTNSIDDAVWSKDEMNSLDNNLSACDFPTIVAMYPQSKMELLGSATAKLSGNVHGSAEADMAASFQSGKCIKKDKDTGKCISRVMLNTQDLQFGMGGTAKVSANADAKISFAINKEWKIERPILTATGLGSNMATWVDRTGIFNGSKTFSIVLRVPKKEVGGFTRENEDDALYDLADLARLASSAGHFFQGVYYEPFHEETYAIAQEAKRLCSSISEKVNVTSSNNESKENINNLLKQIKKNGDVFEHVTEALLYLGSYYGSGYAKSNGKGFVKQASLTKEESTNQENSGKEKLSSFEYYYPFVSYGIPCEKENSDECKKINLPFLYGVGRILCDGECEKNALPPSYGIDNLEDFITCLDYTVPGSNGVNKQIPFARMGVLYDYLRKLARDSYLKIHGDIADLASEMHYCDLYKGNGEIKWAENGSGKNVEIVKRLTERYRFLLGMNFGQVTQLKKRIQMDWQEDLDEDKHYARTTEKYAKMVGLQAFRDKLARTTTEVSGYPLENIRFRLTAYTSFPEGREEDYDLDYGVGQEQPIFERRVIEPAESNIDKGIRLFNTIEGALTIVKPTQEPAKVPDIALHVSSNAAAAIVTLTAKGKTDKDAVSVSVSGKTGMIDLSAGCYMLTANKVEDQYPIVFKPDGTQEAMTKDNNEEGVEICFDKMANQQTEAIHLVYAHKKAEAPNTGTPPDANETPAPSETKPTDQSTPDQQPVKKPDAGTEDGVIKEETPKPDEKEKASGDSDKTAKK